MTYDIPSPRQLTAFRDMTRISSGPAPEVAIAIRAAQSVAPNKRYLAFDRITGAFVDLDLSGTDVEIAARLTPQPPAPKRGRPKLGVTSKEVTLLPRHWDWLAQQPGGASATLRKLVDAARKAPADPRQIRKQAMARADTFMGAMMGDQPGYEDAARALYAGDATRFHAAIADWPTDPADFACTLAAPAFEEH